MKTHLTKEELVYKIYLSADKYTYTRSTTKIS